MNKSTAADSTQGAIDSYLTNAGLLAEELKVHGDSVTFRAMMKAELNVVQKR